MSIFRNPFMSVVRYYWLFHWVTAAIVIYETSFSYVQSFDSLILFTNITGYNRRGMFVVNRVKWFKFSIYFFFHSFLWTCVVEKNITVKKTAILPSNLVQNAIAVFFFLFHLFVWIHLIENSNYIFSVGRLALKVLFPKSIDSIDWDYDAIKNQ